MLELIKKINNKELRSDLLELNNNDDYEGIRDLLQDALSYGDIRKTKNIKALLNKAIDLYWEDIKKGRL